MPVEQVGARWMMWSGSMGARPLEERLRATARAGYHRMSVSPMEIADRVTGGLSFGEIRTVAARREVRLAVLDPIVSWAPTSAASWPPARFSVDDVLKMAEQLQVESISAVAVRSRRRRLEDHIELFAELCDTAGSSGLQVELEFVPDSGVPDLRTAWEIVRLADRANGGLVLDSWHFFQGDPDFELLAAIPGERIFEVQLSDGIPVEGSLMEEMYHHRCLPGDGIFDLAALVRALAGTNGLRSVGPEVLSDALHARDSETAALLAAQSVDRCITAALGSGAVS